MANFLLIAVAVLFAFHVVGVALLLRNQRWLRWPPEERLAAGRRYPITVIVPARNEQADVAACLRSLLAQEGVELRVLAVNDHSEDSTGRIMDEVAATDPRLSVIHDPPLQPGWLGKHNAIQAALERVETEYVLLTDADVVFHPSCLSLAAAELEARRLDLLSVYPQLQFVTICETLLLPIYVAGFALLLPPDVVDPRCPRAMAVGAFILVRAAALRAVGGFEGQKATILDDVGLACAFKAQGFSVGLRSAPDLMRVRLFKSNRDAFWGVTKHLLGFVQAFIWLAPLLAVAPLLMYGVLLTGLVCGLWSDAPVVAGLAFATLAIHYGSFFLMGRSYSFSAWKALAFPAVSVPFAFCCGLASYQILIRGVFQWRGRDLQIRNGR
jgi:chlorobactene glucosyltransferase